MVSQTEARVGDVTRVSSYGFQLNNQTRWYNLSKFVKGLALPAVGEVIEVRLDKGYVVQITKQTSSQATNPARSPIPQASRTSGAPTAPAEPQPFAPEPDELPFEPLPEPPFLDPDTLPFDESLEDAPEVSSANGVSWESGPVGTLVSPSESEKDTQTVRMNALANAVAILSSGGRSCDADEVLKLAGRLEAWVNRAR